MSHIKDVHNIIRNAAAPAGFIKVGTRWRRETSDAILIIEPDKSSYGPQYYINLGMYWKALGDDTNPHEWECHIRGRLEAFLPGRDERLVYLIRKCLNFEDQSVDLDKRNAVLVDFISNHGIPFLELCSTRAGILEQHKSGALRGLAVMVTFKRELGLPLDL